MKIHLADNGTRRTYCGIAFVAYGTKKKTISTCTKKGDNPITVKPSWFVGDCTCLSCFKVWNQ